MKEGKWILVVTEKPSVAQIVAKVLGVTQKKNGYLEGNGYLVTWCIGHLVEPSEPAAYTEEWKKWSYESLPIIPECWRTEVKSDTKAQFDVVRKLMNDDRVTELIEATDSGREGELIFRSVYEKAGCKKPFLRLWVSSMEECAIREGFENLKPGKEYDHLYESALCRQRADWLVGMNATRLFTVLYGGRVLKVGRVQTPTLAMLVDREEQIRVFKKELYYTAHILMDGIDAASERIDSQEQVESIATAAEGRTAVVRSVIREKKTIKPPKLYDLTSLQRDANRIFGFTAKQTLEYAQSLYEKKLLTYPRTDSRYLTEDMEGTALAVLDAVHKSGLSDGVSAGDVRRVIDGTKVSDHHAIIPTCEIAAVDMCALPDGEMAILSLAANRLQCAMGEEYEYETVRAEIECNGTTYTATGKNVIRQGWRELEVEFGKQSEQTDAGEQVLTELTEGMVFENVQSMVKEHFTKAPQHYTDDTLLSAMERAGTDEMENDVERKGLGTPATRADIIEKLVHDGFVVREERFLIPTDDGLRLVALLPDMVKSAALTAEWENALARVSKGELAMNGFMGGIEDLVKDLVQTYHCISDDQKAAALSAKILGQCPKCGNDVLKGKYGAYCKGKCGMNLHRVRGVELSDEQIRDLLEGRRTFVKGLKGKAGNSFDAYLVSDGVKEHAYTKDGKEIHGAEFQTKLDFSPRKKK